MNDTDVPAAPSNLYLLNSAVLTGFGLWRFEPLGVEEARRALAGGFVSAVGHPASAEFLGKLLGICVPVQRVSVKLVPGERAVVFRLLERLPEGKVLGEDDLRRASYELGLLTRME